MIFIKGEFVRIDGTIWHGKYGQVAKVDIDNRFPYRVYIVDDKGETQICMFGRGRLHLADRQEDQVHISKFLSRVKK